MYPRPGLRLSIPGDPERKPRTGRPLCPGYARPLASLLPTSRRLPHVHLRSGHQIGGFERQRPAQPNYDLQSGCRFALLEAIDIGWVYTRPGGELVNREFDLGATVTQGPTEG